MQGFRRFAYQLELQQAREYGKVQIEEQIEERISRADLYKDLPRGRKRQGWKKEFLNSLKEAAQDIGEVSEDEILRTVRSCRR